MKIFTVVGRRDIDTRREKSATVWNESINFAR